MHFAFCIATWYNAMNSKIIYALGFFDGVHLGHQALLTACKSLAKRTGSEPAAVTFAAHPDTLVLGKTPALINTIDDRINLLTGYGMQDTVVLPFDRKMQAMPWREFLWLLKEKYGAKGLICGEDFRFGNRGEGNADRLAAWCKENDMVWAVVSQQKMEGVAVSSTCIRSLLEQGDLETAGRFLGHPHVLTGTVVPGRKLGRTIGIPTANILLPEGVVTLPNGVYACKAGEHLAVTNIGSRPTVGGHQTRAESWLLDFNGDLYGKELTLEFYRFLRPERKFESLEELKREIQKDAAQTRRYFDK